MNIFNLFIISKYKFILLEICFKFTFSHLKFQIEFYFLSRTKINDNLMLNNSNYKNEFQKHDKNYAHLHDS
jgi:hypothetical protein